MVFLCLTTEAYIHCMENFLQLNFYAAVILSCCNKSLLHIFIGCLIAIRVTQTPIQRISCSSLVTKNGDFGSPLQTNAANDLVLHINQGGPYVPLSLLLECHHYGKSFKLHGLKLILLYYLAHIASVLVLYHFWWLVPVFLVYGW